MKPTILVFAGSLRKGSLNKKLAGVAARAAERAGAAVTHIDLADFPMPAYDGDIESSTGIPEPAMRLKEHMKAAGGMLLVCPEYNSSISSPLKNAIDWASRKADREKPLECFDGKVAALMSASPGALGGLRGLVHVRAILGNIGMLVLPEQFALSQADKAFDEAGELIDDAKQKRVEAIARRQVETVRRLRGE